MSNLLDRLQDMVDFKHDDMDVAREAIEEIVKLEAQHEEQAAEIARLRAAIERLAQWHDAHAAHYEDEERKFNALLDGMSIAANFAQAKFQHRQRAAAIRAAAKEGKP